MTTATLACPICGASGMAFGTTACASCGVQFASPVVAPTLREPMSTSTAVAPAADAVEYASIWRRMPAAALDSLLVGLPFMLFVGFGNYWSTDGGTGATWFISTEPWQFVELAAYTAYVVVLVSSTRQATLGMRVFDLRLVGEDDGATISAMRAFGRELLTYVSAIILFIGYLMILFTKKRQALHDILTKTVVVHDR